MDILKAVCDIIQKGMNLSDDQIWIYNQKIDIPNDKRIYVVVSLKGENVIGNNIQEENEENKLNEIVWSNIITDVGIEMFSYNVNALNRRYEILSSMRSTYSVQKQEELNFNISRRPVAFFDSSFFAPSSRLYSYYFMYRVTHIEKFEKEIDFYNNFIDANMSNKENLKINL